jgi:hypothetical protein
MIALERILEHPELAPLARLPEAFLELAYEPTRAKARQPAPQAKGHVSGTCTRQIRTSAVLDTRPRTWRPAGAVARAATPRSPAHIVEGELRRHDGTVPHWREEVKNKNQIPERFGRCFEVQPSPPTPPLGR